MAYMIVTDTCTVCGSCESECPNKAISHKGRIYSIDPKKCRECEGDYEAPQCDEVCPSGSCIPIAA